jgi:hypothetical protein
MVEAAGFTHGEIMIAGTRSPYPAPSTVGETTWS